MCERRCAEAPHTEQESQQPSQSLEYVVDHEVESCNSCNVRFLVPASQDFALVPFESLSWIGSGRACRHGRVFWDRSSANPIPQPSAWIAWTAIHRRSFRGPPRTDGSPLDRLSIRSSHGPPWRTVWVDPQSDSPSSVCVRRDDDARSWDELVQATMHKRYLGGYKGT